MEKLVIDRKKWLRGQGAGTLLVTEDWRDAREPDIFPVGNMCCLGFECLRHGVSEDELGGETFPKNLSKRERVKLPAWLGQIDTNGDHIDETVVVLARVNDATDLSEGARELEITRLFATQGVEVEFIN